jgi:hypothetical protein
MSGKESNKIVQVVRILLVKQFDKGELTCGISSNFIFYDESFFLAPEHGTRT